MKDGSICLVSFILITPYFVFYSRICVNIYCVRIRSFSCLFFPTFGLDTEIYRVNLRIRSECEKIRTRKTSNADFLSIVLEKKI